MNFPISFCPLENSGIRSSINESKSLLIQDPPVPVVPRLWGGIPILYQSTGKCKLNCRISLGFLHKWSLIPLKMEKISIEMGVRRHSCYFCIILCILCLENLQMVLFLRLAAKRGGSAQSPSPIIHSFLLAPVRQAGRRIHISPTQSPSGNRSPLPLRQSRR